MSSSEPSEDEWAGLDVVRRVVEVADYERLVPSGRDGEGTPDWRVWIAQERVADVEVTLCTDENTRRFTESLSPRGSPRYRADERLSYEWAVVVGDLSPNAEGNSRIGQIRKAIGDALAAVEGQCDSPEQLEDAARTAFLRHAEVGRCCGDAQYVGVMKEPQHMGVQRGGVRTYGVAPLGLYPDHRRLVPLIQRRIDSKARQLSNSPDLKWLVVILDGEAVVHFNEFFGPESPLPHPRLEGISFKGIDEVWMVVRHMSYTVLRLCKEGDRQQHCVVPRC